MTDDHERQRRKFLRHRKDNATPVAIVCTDRKEHRRVHLAPVIFFADENVVELSEVLLLRESGSGAVVPAGAADRRAAVRVPKTGEFTPDALKAAAAWEFSCPLCSRKPRVPKALLIAAVTSGAKVVDVSYTD